jgi:UDP-N-acetylmuramyl pentapeptide synthase
LAGQIAAQLQAGDAVMIKGSLGTNMAPIVKAVREIGRAIGHENKTSGA